MPEQAVPLPSTVAEVLTLGTLVAAGDAARVALGRLHLGASAVEPILKISLRGTLARSALLLFAARRHRSSVIEVGVQSRVPRGH